MKIGEKIKKIWKEHKEAAIVGGIAVIGFVTAIVLSARNNSEEDRSEDNLITSSEDEYDPRDKYSEEYADQFDVLKDVAGGLGMEDDDTFIIAGPKSDYNAEGDGIDVMLLKDGWYVYPKDVESDENETEEKESPINREVIDDLVKSKWNDDLYRENWDKVHEFAESLNLLPGESYIIEDKTQFYDESWFQGEKDDIPVISHMVNGHGIYPDSEEE